METTADRLRYLMKTRNLKQVDILNLCKPYCDRYFVKIGRSDLSQFVNGRVRPGQWKLSILGMALGVSEAWLMGLDVPMERQSVQDEKAEDEYAKEKEDAETKEMVSIFASLSSDSRSRLIELGRLYRLAEGKTEEN